LPGIYRFSCWSVAQRAGTGSFYVVGVSRPLSSRNRGKKKVVSSKENPKRYRNAQNNSKKGGFEELNQKNKQRELKSNDCNMMRSTLPCLPIKGLEFRGEEIGSWCNEFGRFQMGGMERGTRTKPSARQQQK